MQANPSEAMNSVGAVRPSIPSEWSDFATLQLAVKSFTGSFVKPFISGVLCVARNQRILMQVPRAGRLIYLDWYCFVCDVWPCVLAKYG